MASKHVDLIHYMLMLWIIINVLGHLLQQVSLLKIRSTEDELHFIVDYHIRQNHAGEGKFERLRE
jgi:hypothetical protein